MNAQSKYESIYQQFERQDESPTYNNQSKNNFQVESPQISINCQLFNHYERQIVGSEISIDQKRIKQKRQIIQKYICILQVEQTKQSSQTKVKNFNQLVNLISLWPNQLIKNKLIIKNENESFSQQKLKSVCKISNNYHYYGNIDKETIHGYGLMIYVNKWQKNQNNEKYLQNHLHFYQGQFQNNSKHGAGLQLLNNTIYIGNFTNNMPNGDYGLLITYNFNFSHIIQMYFGTFVNGQKHGEGKWKGQTGEYFGVWKYNYPDGQGQLINRGSKYKGNIKAGNKHGKGKQLFSNGDRYQGDYVNGKPQGIGTYYWNNGAMYKGQFQHGFRHGFGQWKFGNQTYTGNYFNDKRWGQGKYYWNQNNFYEGQFQDDLRHGYGEMNWNQQTIYRGQWKRGHQSGRGEVWTNNQITQKGIYQDGLLIKSFQIQKQNQIQSKKLVQNQKRVQNSKKMLKDNKSKNQKQSQQKLKKQEIFHNRTKNQQQVKLKNPLNSSIQIKKPAKYKKSNEIGRKSLSQVKKETDALQRIDQIPITNRKVKQKISSSAYGSVYLPKTQRDNSNSNTNTKIFHLISKNYRANSNINQSFDSKNRNISFQSNLREKKDKYQSEKSNTSKLNHRKQMSSYVQHKKNLKIGEQKDRLQPINWKNFSKFQHRTFYGASNGRYSLFNTSNK